MLKLNELSTRLCVKDDKDLFESVAKSYNNAKDSMKEQYSILDYEKILDQMIDYIDGYKKYADSNDDKYEGKVLAVSHNFYDQMFTDKKKYRKVITLDQFKSMNSAYLKKTKVLQGLIEVYLNQDEISGEMDSILRLTNNQYKKLARICRDDMKIYLWLTTADSKFFAFHIDESTRKAFADKNTPVMHRYKKDLS